MSRLCSSSAIKVLSRDSAGLLKEQFQSVSEAAVKSGIAGALEVPRPYQGLTFRKEQLACPMSLQLIPVLALQTMRASRQP